MAEHIAAVGDLEGEVDVLLDEQYAAAGLLGVLADERQQALDDHWGESEAELVEEQQPGSSGEGAGDSEHLLLPSGQQPGATPGEIPEGGKVAVGDVGVEALAAVAESEMLGDGEPEEQTATFRHVGDPETGARARRAAGEIVAAEQDAPVQRADDPGDRPQRRRLTGPVGTEQGNDLALADRQGDLADDGRFAISSCQGVDREDRLTARTSLAHAQPPQPPLPLYPDRR